MTDAVFHVGFGKTGTSSLQTFLTETADANLGNSPFAYCAIEPGGAVLSGIDLVRKGKKSVLGYISSTTNISENLNLAMVKAGLDSISHRGHIPVLSQEAYGRNAAKFTALRFFEALDCRVHVVAYVRPQVDYFNSGWWQWWAWDKRFSCPEDVISLWRCNFMRWGHSLKLWKSVPGVSKVTIRLHHGNIVENFLQVLGIQGYDENILDNRKNVSLSPMLIRLYKSVPALRAPYGAKLDAILTSTLGGGGRAPWIVTPKLASTIISELRAENEQLMEELDPDQRELMRNDPRWWSADVYPAVDNACDVNLDQKECIKILEKTIPEMARLRNLLTS